MGTHPIFESDFDCLTAMAKRKSDCILKLVHYYLKDQKCIKTLELFENEVDTEIIENSKMYEKFLDGLSPGRSKRKENSKSNKSPKTIDEKPTKNYDLGFEINFDVYQKTKKKPKVKFSKTKVPTDFRVARRNCDQEGVSKLFDTEGALITVVEKTRKKSESSKQFWELIKDRGLKRPGMHSKYC